MAGRRLWQTINQLSEDELRVQVVIPVLRATPNVVNVTDVHGQNERGLDIIFFTDNEIESICYGLQLKKGNISGGGTGAKTVKQIVDQLELADEFSHPVATKNAGNFQIDRFIVATSGTISSTARTEIASRLKSIPVQFWDGHEVIRRIHRHLPQLFHLADGATASYLGKVVAKYDVLDTLDQIPGVAKRTLSQVFEEPRIGRIFDPSVAGAVSVQSDGSSIGAYSIFAQEHNAVLISEQDGGKTALFRILAVKRAQGILDGSLKGLPVPLLVSAKSIINGGLSVVDACRSALMKFGESELADTVEADLAAGNYYLCVDGFSELHLEQDKERVAALIEDFAAKYEVTRVLVAARPADFLTPRYLSEFYHYRIEEFNAKQTASLVRRWLGDSSGPADVAQKMVDRLREALQLPGSPIPATIGVMVHEQQGRYITNTAEAIERYMVIRLGRYAHELGMKQEIDWARKQDLLAEVAFELVEQDQDTIGAADFIARIEAIQIRQGDQPRGSVVLEELVHSGVLSREQNSLGFFRTSFRDFFAGHHLHQRGDLDTFAVQKVFDRRWGGVIVFAAGLRRKNSGLPESFGSASLMSNPTLPVSIQGMHVSAGAIYLDFRAINSFMAMFWKYGADVQVQWSGNPPDCAGESAMYFALDDLEKEIDAAIAALSPGSSSGSPLEITNMCPDSLMSENDTCLDFFIMAPTIAGIGLGNGRGSDPFANVNQSKVQFVPHFESGTYNLLISGSSFFGPLPSGPYWTATLYHAAPNNWQTQKFEIQAVSATERIVELKIVNAECGAITQELINKGVTGALLAGLTAAACPAIDAKIHYTRLQDGNWFPTYIERDAYPTLDIFEKTASGMVQRHHSREANPYTGLTGLQRLKYEIQREKGELLNDPTCQLQ